ncbi:MAG: DoxX family protein [Terracidiphilus sp.]
MPRNVPMLLIRIVVGIVFITEGVLKFLYPGELGAGRFAHIGLPWPHLLAPVVGALEVAAGAAVILNFYAGDAAIVLLSIIATALVSTKLPILLGHAVGPFQLSKSAEHHGMLGFIHEARTDLAMLFSLVAILVDSGVRGGSRSRR